jgi:hypothetical protein
MADTIKVSIELADQAAQNALSNFISNAGKADKQMKNLQDSGESAFSRITLGITKALGVQEIFVGSLASNIVSKAFESIKESIGHIIEAAAQSEQAVKNLNVALSSSGQFSQKASTDFQEFAHSIQSVTKYSEDAVLASSTLLLNLTSLSTDGIKKATQAAVDLATTLNVDLPTATLMIEKAIEGNVKSFKKLGIEIQSSGTEAGRLTNLLDALQSQQGNAANQAETYAGATEKAKNQQEELFKALGKLFTQSEATISATKLLSDVYASAAKFVTQYSTEIRELATAFKYTAEIALLGVAGYGIVTGVLGVLAVAAYTGATGFGVLGVAAEVAWLAVTGPVGLVIAGVALVGAAIFAVIHYWQDIKIKTYEAIAATLEFAATAASLVSSGLADSLNKQAKGYRDLVSSTIEANEAAKKKAKEDAERENVDSEQEKIRADRLKRANADYYRHLELLRSDATINAEELIAINEGKNIAIAELDAVYEEERELKLATFDVERSFNFAQAAKARLLAQQKNDKAELELQIAKQVAAAKSEKDEVKRKEALDAVEQKSSLSRQALANKQEIDLEKQKNDALKKSDAEKLSNRDSSLKLFATLASSHNQTLAAIGKAAAITQIAIDTPKAVSAAFAFGTEAGGPVVGGIFAAVALAAELALAAQAAGVQFANGGIVPGESTSGDLVQARLNSGEMVLNKVQQTNLFDLANGQDKTITPNTDTSLTDKIGILTNRIEQLISQPLIVQVDGRELFNITRGQLASGRSY